jgi:methylmalonyl-CoA/ethylmalonyl-CoA epimerase
VIRLSHVGLVVNDLDKAVQEWCTHFGMVVVDLDIIEVEGVRNALLSTASAAPTSTCIELIEPLDKGDMSNAIARRLAANGEGVYHAAFLVDDPALEAARLRGVGVEVIDLAPVNVGEHGRVVVHPRSANGLLLELIAARPLSANGRSAKDPSRTLTEQRGHDGEG